MSSIIFISERFENWQSVALGRLKLRVIRLIGCADSIAICLAQAITDLPLDPTFALDANIFCIVKQHHKQIVNSVTEAISIESVHKLIKEINGISAS